MINNNNRLGQALLSSRDPTFNKTIMSPPQQQQQQGLQADHLDNTPPYNNNKSTSWNEFNYKKEKQQHQSLLKNKNRLRHRRAHHAECNPMVLAMLLIVMVVVVVGCLFSFVADHDNIRNDDESFLGIEFMAFDNNDFEEDIVVANVAGSPLAVAKDGDNHNNNHHRLTSLMTAFDADDVTTEIKQLQQQILNEERGTVDSKVPVMSISLPPPKNVIQLQQRQQKQSTPAAAADDETVDQTTTTIENQKPIKIIKFCRRHGRFSNLLVFFTGYSLSLLIGGTACLTACCAGQFGCLALQAAVLDLMIVFPLNFALWVLYWVFTPLRYVWRHLLTWFVVPFVSIFHMHPSFKESGLDKFVLAVPFAFRLLGMGNIYDTTEHHVRIEMRRIMQHYFPRISTSNKCCRSSISDAMLTNTLFRLMIGFAMFPLAWWLCDEMYCVLRQRPNW